MCENSVVVKIVSQVKIVWYVKIVFTRNYFHLSNYFQNNTIFTCLAALSVSRRPANPLSVSISPKPKP
jgi:hypothetical protein